MGEGRDLGISYYGAERYFREEGEFNVKRVR